MCKSTPMLLLNSVLSDYEHAQKQLEQCVCCATRMHMKMEQQQ